MVAAGLQSLPQVFHMISISPYIVKILLSVFSNIASLLVLNSCYSWVKEPNKHYQPHNFQLQTTLSTASGVCNGSGKPRVRARRGQATDPHSIAERVSRKFFMII